MTTGIAGAPVAPAAPSVAAGVARAAATALLRRLDGGRLTLVEQGRRTVYGEGDGPGVTLTILDPRAWPLVLRGGGVGLAEGYLAGYWDSDDLVALVRLFARNLDRLEGALRMPLGLTRRARTVLGRGAAPADADDRRNIAAHYDLGNDFFEVFLDPTMAYSCALFERPGMSLEEASRAKFERICRRLGIDERSRVVEIGGGWGGFALHAAREHGAHVTTTTISAQQYARIRERVDAAGLGDRVTVLQEHYRDLRGEFTHLVAIEMIEAVDWRLYDEFFATVARLLRPDGLAALQAIVVPDDRFERSKVSADYIKRYIFPGGCLPSVEAMTRSARRAGMGAVDLLDVGAHYVTTLRIWHQRFEAGLPAVRELGFDEEFVRRWRYYLAYCEAGFAERRVSDVQLVLAREEWRGPLAA